jgi:ketosteroid isomerase-like protein
VSGTEEVLRRLEDGLMRAVKKRDVARLDRMLGENFVLTTGRAGAEIRSRQKWLAVTRERYRIEGFEFEWVRVEAYGDAAVVRSRYRQEAEMGGKDRTGAYLMTGVWVRRGSTWSLVTRHITPTTP